MSSHFLQNKNSTVFECRPIYKHVAIGKYAIQNTDKDASVHKYVHLYIDMST
jgi:hypothetical protein